MPFRVIIDTRHTEAISPCNAPAIGDLPGAQIGVVLARIAHPAARHGDQYEAVRPQQGGKARKGLIRWWLHVLQHLRARNELRAVDEVVRDIEQIEARVPMEVTVDVVEPSTKCTGDALSIGDADAHSGIVRREYREREEAYPEL